MAFVTVEVIHVVKRKYIFEVSFTGFFCSKLILTILSFRSNSDGMNSCRLDNMECAMQMDNFPAFLSTDNVCNGVETSDSVLPYGCGCKLSDTLPCTYNPALQEEFDDRCYICSTKDIVDGKCPDCVECLKHCDSCAEAATDSFLFNFADCLSTMDSSCRTQCNAACKKEPDHSALTGFKVKITKDEHCEFDCDIYEMLEKFGITKGMLYCALPFAALVMMGMLIGCFFSKR